MIKELMEFLIGVVDAELFEGIDGEVFKPEDVEDTEDTRRLLAWVGACIDVVHQPRERPRVKRFGHRMSVFPGLNPFR